MGAELQKASVWKRISAWIFDAILLGVLAVGLAFLLSSVLGYDNYSDALDAAYASYEEAYGVIFDIGEEEYLAMTDEQRENYDAAYQALIADEEAMHAYNMVINLNMVIITVGILLATLIMEFAVPLLFDNGQTLGKKIFGIGVMRTDGVHLPPMQLFIRTVLGKFTIETMLPVYLLQMLLLGSIDLLGLVLLVALLLAQVICLIVTRTNSALHDLLAGTVTVDFASQRIFSSPEELIAYTKRIHAERAAQQSYF